MRVRTAAYAVITRGRGDETEILLSHWRAGDKSGWTLPGGGLEPGEHPEEAAVREVAEETGFNARLTGLVGVDSIVVPVEDRFSKLEREPMQSLRIVYTAEIVSGELTIEVDGSSDDAGWFRLSALKDLRRVSLVDAAMRMLGGNPLRPAGDT